ncbi:SMI1/KNR4 family protein [Metaplanococcus flavidus]
MINVWDKGNDEFKLQPLTDEIFKEAEETFGVKLPESYYAILNEQNGGSIIYNAFPSATPTAWAETFIAIDHIRGIGHENGILNNAYFLKEWDMPKGLILFSGDGHSWFAFDYRSTNINPTIVYVDNEMKQIIQVAGSFEEFLTNLHNEESTYIDEGNYAEKDYSEEDLLKLIKQNNIEEISMALIQFSEKDIDEKWFSNQLLQLSTHPSVFIRMEVAGIVHNISYRVKDEILNRMIKNFEDDKEADVQLYANMIKENMNFTLEQLKQEAKQTGTASFFYDGVIYHINKHTGLWHLSDYQTDFHSFRSLKKLIDQATINGEKLEEIWSQAKKV